MADFWEGLKRRAFHVVKHKDPLRVGDVKDILESGAASIDNLGKACADKASAPPWKSVRLDFMVARLAAAVAVAFFGVRRASEVVALGLSDLRALEHDSRTIFVFSQKNDQFGKGHECFVPHMESWDSASPLVVFEGWVRVRVEFLPLFDKHGILTAPVLPVEQGDLPVWKGARGAKKPPWDVLFPGLAGSRYWGKQISGSAFVASLKGFLQFESTPSPRKGGQIFLRDSGASSRVAKHIGGWASEQVMETFYDAVDGAQSKAGFLKAAKIGAAELQAVQAVKMWGAARFWNAEGSASVPRRELRQQLSEALLKARDVVTWDICRLHCPDIRDKINNALEFWRFQPKSQGVSLLKELRSRLDRENDAYVKGIRA